MSSLYATFISTYLSYAIFICAIILFILHFWSRRRIYAFASCCSSPSYWPIIGHATYFMGNGEHLVKTFLKFGETYRGQRLFLWIFSRPICFVQTTADAAIILNSPQCLAKSFTYDKFKFLIGDGILTTPPNRWRVIRKILAPAFTKRVIDLYVPAMNKHAKKLVSDLDIYADCQTTIQLDHYLTNFMCRLFYETSVGLNPEKDVNNDLSTFHSLIEKIKIYSYNLMGNMRSIDYYIRSPGIRRCKKALREFTKSVILTKKKERIEDGKLNKNGNHHPVLKNEQQEDFASVGQRPLRSFLDLLLDVAGETFSVDELCDEVITFLIAGMDTSSLTIGFALQVLGMSEDIQRLVHDELDTFFADRHENEPIHVSDLPQLTYLERVIKETMRLFPASSAIGRRIEADVTLKDGVTLPAGVEVILPIINLHRSPDLWQNPLEFNPDRFLVTDQSNENLRHPYAFLPFSAGPRNCIGKLFAEMSVKIALSTFLRLYSVKTITTAKTPAELRLQTSFSLKPVEGFNVQLSRRKRTDG